MNIGGIYMNERMMGMFFRATRLFREKINGEP